ncbi:hypothetical protein FFLO_03118 [Filobasidium floriforme]|uniref:Uncharacterized protein n=1 Tax=Filobasidium floriforme TaxID=5210 RepID=A0A8K0JRN8_9TREE|nr:uncharacterized protein HD553DRAFT_304756 [Filobasidium floriforme]KAG7549005.1 hypothetical protein FFLO_03118 [Filobasidium floriforme]KAH8089773.1 hypothetical protein HD553DRAFT_304756 [Filobasidium floriforme]
MASSAERRRDSRLDALFGGGPEGKPDLEQIRQARIADRQEQLRWMVDQALERFESRRTDVSHDGIIGELNRRRERCHLPAIENTLLADALQKSHPLAELFCQLLNDPLGLDPSGHPALELATVELDDVGKSGGAAKGEQGDTETYEIEQDEGGFSLEVYLRIVRLTRERSLELLEQWKDRYPVDWWHIETKRQAWETADEMVSWIYAGATIATTAQGRLQHDETQTQGRRARFSSMLRPDESFTVYRIPALAVADLGNTPGTTCQDVWDIHPAVLVEMDLIAAMSRELSLNSAFGGPSFVRWRDSTEVRDMVAIVDSLLSDTSPSDQDPVVLAPDPALREELDGHYRMMREVAAEEHMKPISSRALEKAIDAASLTTRRVGGDGTSLFLNVAKDIPIRDAFSNASWYGPVAGAASRYYRYAGPDHGPFVDFWAVCICHILFRLFLGFFWKTLSILRPRVIICQSDKVCQILRSNKASVENVRELSGNSGSTEDDWTDQADGDFIRCWLGKITLVQLADGQWSLLLHRFHCGLMSYRPDLTWHLHELNVLVALKGRILFELAADQATWSKSAASIVQKQSEELFETIGLKSLWEEKLQVYLELQTGIFSLSRCRKSDEDFDQLLEEALIRGARMAQIRQRTLDAAVTAAGEPSSDERLEQIHDLAQSSHAPCPDGMSVGDSDWKFWLESRKMGCVLAESARRLCLQQDTDELKQAAARARKALANAQDKRRLYPGYTSYHKPEDVLMWLANVNTATAARSSVVTGYRLVTCRICHKVGIIKGQMAMHFCMKDGQLLQGEKITYREPHLEIVRLLIPAQLLVHPVFGTRLQSWAAERGDTISLERSRCCYENDIPSVLYMTLKEQENLPEFAEFYRLQQIVAVTVEYQVTNGQKTLEQILWRPHHDDHIISRHYLTMAKINKLERRRRGGGSVSPDRQDDLPLDYTPPAFDPFTWNSVEDLESLDT